MNGRYVKPFDYRWIRLRQRVAFLSYAVGVGGFAGVVVTLVVR